MLAVRNTTGRYDFWNFYPFGINHGKFCRGTQTRERPSETLLPGPYGISCETFFLKIVITPIIYREMKIAHKRARGNLKTGLGAEFTIFR